MSQQTPAPATRSRWLRRIAIGAVVLVPLAFAGLFVGALSQTTTSIDRIPAAVVNDDTLVYQTAADGTKTPVFAGRQLVTELTGGKGGFDWTISNKADAAKALKNGTVDAVLTVPKDFSSSILSLSSANPVKGELSIHTDDAHSYLTGAVAQIVGSSLTSAFGKTITEQYIAGLSSGVGTLGTSLSSAADGATGLASGATDLSTGLASLADGATSAQSGATQLSSGVSKYTSGADALSSGLATLNSNAANLTPLSQGISAASAAVAQYSAELSADPQDPTIPPKLAAASAQLSALAAQNAQLSPGIASGVAQSASGAARLSSGSAALRSGASGLATGLGSLTGGATSAQSGATQLSSGATQLADGLKAGVAQLPTTDAAAAKKAASVAADPIGVTVIRQNQIKDIGQVIATFFVPLGLWIGALAVFLVLRPLTRRALGSTAGNGRLVVSTIARASVVTVGQALLLTALVHFAVGVSWASLPAVLAFSVLMALAFTAFHYLLTIGLGRAGLVVSLFLLAVQITSTGGLYPVQLLATPFQVISPFLPLTYGVQGMQGIIAGGDVGPVVQSALVLLAFGIGSVLVSMLAIRRTRRAGALGLTPVIAPRARLRAATALVR
ncbi:YhgE/Pip family protein [Lacisediminihabitans changchengi]|uniref:YhgE/Pip family protein n=1 Tax=Lacisediminihabitans changchengi TaxID=2787634 RepID=A0A934SJE4_9MICO|nr:YhgE/Pip family protein [Lacisediminihabitans changchengi]MBK4346376.1 YhgE/Pip family protein [Lacisediminihabitans changchengi]